MGLLATLLGHATDVTPEETREDLEGILLPDEAVEVAFKVVRDLFVFTDKRLILVDKQGLTSRKVDYLVVPYRAITSYSIETAGTLDMDSELITPCRAEPIQKTLKRGANIRGIQAAMPRLCERHGTRASVQSHPLSKDIGLLQCGAPGF